MSSEELNTNGANYTKTTHADTYDYISPTKADLTGKSVFVTGASRGIGRETAISYARAGASSIALGARSSLAAIESEIQAAAKAAGRPAPKVLSVVLDVTDPKSAEQAASRVKAEFGGGLDILINNAGYLEPFVPIAKSDPDEWWKTWEVNIKGPYLITRAFIPLLLAKKDGLKTILNVTSIGAHVKMQGASAYQITKLALLRFSEFVDLEYGSQGILALNIHPGGVLTELADNFPGEFRGLLSDQPALAADTIVWLTKERRDWLAARYISVTWDMQELEAKRTEIEKKDLLKVRMTVQ